LASPTLPRYPKRVGGILINAYCDVMIDYCAQMENGKWCARLGRIDAGRQVVILPGCTGPDRLGQAIPLQSPSNKTTRLAKVAAAGFKPHAQFEGRNPEPFTGNGGKDFSAFCLWDTNLGFTCNVRSGLVQSSVLLYSDLRGYIKYIFLLSLLCRGF